MQREVAQIILREEQVKHVRGDHHRGWNGNAHAGKPPRDATSAQQVPHKSQAARFASERTGTDPEEARLRGLERVRLEVTDQDLVLLTAVVVDGLDQITAQVLRAVEVRHFARPEFGSQRKFRARHQPVREVIALRMVQQALGGQHLQGLFQFVQILGAANFLLVGHAEDKITEAELIGQNAPQIFQQRGRPFTQERVPLGMRARTKFGPARLENNRNVRCQAPDHASQLETSFGTELAFPGEFHIRDQAENVVPILLHELRGLFKI